MAGSMSGTVIDIRDNMPLDGVALAAKEDGGQGSGSATSDGEGKWGPISLPAGTYDLTATKSGYETGIYPGIVVLEGFGTQLPLALHPAGYFD